MVVSAMFSHGEDRDEQRGGYYQPQDGRQSILITLGVRQYCCRFLHSLGTLITRS